MNNLNDIMIFNDDKINNYDELENKFKKNIITQKDLIKITSIYLSKHLNKLCDSLITSQFRYFYECGWLGRKFFYC